MSVYEIKRPSLLNVPAKLRELADQYERHAACMRTAIVIIGYDDGTVVVRGYGERTDALQATGWMHRALDAMTNASMRPDEDIPCDTSP